MTRRDWLRALGVAGASLALTRKGPGQQVTGKVMDTSNLFPMDQSAVRSVRLAPKPNAIASMSAEDRDALEGRLRCQCGCTMDVYTCRTTDFSCQVSPAMHRDVLALVQGGYSAEEILDAFVNVYGERVLMAPPKTGFNIFAYVVPATAVATGAIVLAFVLRGWSRRASQPVPSAAPTPAGSPEERAHLEAAIRDDS